MWKVQRSANRGAWQTICTTEDETYCRTVFDKQLKVYSTGKFRILHNDKVMLEKEARPLFAAAVDTE